MGINETRHRPGDERRERRVYSYCFFCNTVKCEAVAAAMCQKFDCKAFSPKIVQRKWIKGTCYEEIRAYLPGYVFVYAEEPIEDFREFHLMEGVLRHLGQRENDFQLMGDDRRFAEMLYAHDGVIGIQKAYEEGDRVKLVKEAFGGFEGEIVKLDRRKGRAQIQYVFDGSTYKVWVGYELIDDGVKL